MIRLLLEAGANPNAQLKLFPPYRSLRMDRGADSILDIGTTPLLRAARAADMGAMELLLEHGADVDLPQVDGITPLMAAAGPYAGASDTRGRFLAELDAVAATRRLLAAGAKIDARDRQGRSALHTADLRGWTGLATVLVEHGADPLATDADGMTAIDAAMGLLSGRGRGDAHEATAEALRQLVADRAEPAA
jgi:ankyrin repeat protein